MGRGEHMNDWSLEYLWSWKTAVLGEDVATLVCVVTAVIVWVVTTPLRDVVWVYGGSLYGYGANVGFFLVICGERYMVAVRSPETLDLIPEDNAWVVLAMVFSVPIAVLSDYEERFGAGVVCYACEAKPRRPTDSCPRSHYQGFYALVQLDAERQSRREGASSVRLDLAADEVESPSPVIHSFLREDVSNIAKMTNFAPVEFERLWGYLRAHVRENWNVGRGKGPSLEHCGQCDIVAGVFKIKSANFQKVVLAFTKVVSPFLDDSLALSVADRLTKDELARLRKSEEEMQLADNGPLKDIYPNSWAVLDDKGYQRLAADFRAITPIKKPPLQSLTLEQTETNDRIAHDRVIVETILAECARSVFFRAGLGLTNFHVLILPLRSEDGENYQNYLKRLQIIGHDARAKRIAVQKRNREKRRLGLRLVLGVHLEHSSAVRPRNGSSSDEGSEDCFKRESVVFD
ncbi:hypothetical protein GQ600_359 [Phytophthora cactorum]|nr:hypothetical protein GQ600_359 [Phytophthora cactorum]